MLSVDDEIRMTKLMLKKAREKLDLMDPNDANNRFKIPNQQSEIRILENKLEQLEEQKNPKIKNTKRKVFRFKRYKK